MELGTGARPLFGPKMEKVEDLSKSCFRKA